MGPGHLGGGSALPAAPVGCHGSRRACALGLSPNLLAPCRHVFTCMHCTLAHVFTFRSAHLNLPLLAVAGDGRWVLFSDRRPWSKASHQFGRIVSSICCRSDSSSVFSSLLQPPIPLAWSAALLSRSTAPVSISPSPLSDSQTPLDRRSLRSDDHRPSSWNAQSRSASP